MAASEDWGHSPCRRQPASTQTRHHKQHHSEDYCERELDDYLGPKRRPSARPARVPQGPGPAWWTWLSSAVQHGDPRAPLVQPVLLSDSGREWWTVLDADPAHEGAAPG